MLAVAANTPLAKVPRLVETYPAVAKRAQDIAAFLASSAVWAGLVANEEQHRAAAGHLEAVAGAVPVRRLVATEDGPNGAPRPLEPVAVATLAVLPQLLAELRGDAARQLRFEVPLVLGRGIVVDACSAAEFASLVDGSGIVSTVDACVSMVFVAPGAAPRELLAVLARALATVDAAACVSMVHGGALHLGLPLERVVNSAVAAIDGADKRAALVGTGRTW